MSRNVGMPNINIELPESIYEALVAKAQAHGQSPIDWIASKVTEPEEAAGTTPSQTLAELLKGRVGRLSYEVPDDIHERASETLSDILAEKHERRRA